MVSLYNLETASDDLTRVLSHSFIFSLYDSKVFDDKDSWFVHFVIKSSIFLFIIDRGCGLKSSNLTGALSVPVVDVSNVTFFSLLLVTSVNLVSSFFSAGFAPNENPPLAGLGSVLTEFDVGVDVEPNENALDPDGSVGLPPNENPPVDALESLVNEVVSEGLAAAAKLKDGTVDPLDGCAVDDVADAPPNNPPTGLLVSDGLVLPVPNENPDDAAVVGFAAEDEVEDAGFVPKEKLGLFSAIPVFDAVPPNSVDLFVEEVVFKGNVLLLDPNENAGFESPETFADPTCVPCLPCVVEPKLPKLPNEGVVVEAPDCVFPNEKDVGAAEEPEVEEAEPKLKPDAGFTGLLVAFAFPNPPNLGVEEGFVLFALLLDPKLKGELLLPEFAVLFAPPKLNAKHIFRKKC